MVLITIIIPVYNSEKYLTQCLESVFNQDLNDSEYEVIVINDGSTDGSSNIIFNYENKHRNMILISQDNQGVSAARNAGLECAKGEYITFVDADDELFPHCLRQAYEYAFYNVLDLLYVKVNNMDETGNITGEFIMNSRAIQISDGFTHQRKGQVFGLYNRRNIGGLRFEKNIPIAEDALFNLFFHAKARRCSYLDSPFYRYRKTSNSALNSDVAKSAKAFRGYLKILALVNDFLKKNKYNFSEEQIRYFDRPLYVTAKMAIDANIIPNNNKERYGMLINLLKEYKLISTIIQIRKDYFFFGQNWLLFKIGHFNQHLIYAVKWKMFKSQ